MNSLNMSPDGLAPLDLPIMTIEDSVDQINNFDLSPHSQSTSKCPLNALGPGSGMFKATCDVTNKINIDKYFELMKEEYSNPNSPTTTAIKPPRSPRKVLSRSASSSTIEPLQHNINNNPFPLSPRRKKNAKKRISCDENSLAKLAAKNNIPRKADCYFNYENPIENHHLSKQKSLDLSRSKERRPVSDDDEDNDVCDLSLSYSPGDFRKLKDENNNNSQKILKSSKSCEAISSLGERHKEYAMMQGKIGSVSEENRKRRRKLYRKSRKGSDERPQSMVEDSSGRINHLLMEKLVIDVG